MADTAAERRPEWLLRKHAKQRSEPYRDMLAEAPRCPAGPGSDNHQRTVIITTVFDLDGNELPIGSEDEARNVSNALYRSRPRGDHGQFLVSLPKPDLVQLPSGGWEVRCCVHDKAAGDAHISADPSRKAYDPQARTTAAATRGPARRRRPSAAAVRQQHDREASARAYRDALKTEPIGGGKDIRIWLLDEGERKPATPEEHARVAAVKAARRKASRAAASPDPAAKPATPAERLRNLLKG